MVVSGQPFIAVDWGTTNRRAYRIEDGCATASLHEPRGVTAVADFAADVADIRERLGDLPMLLAGMVGSTIGWRDAGYVAVPAGTQDIAARLTWIDARTAIGPGLSACADDRGDVMRGEEVQVLGAAAAGLVPPDATVVQPGTHSKWVTLSGGRIADFTTAMTGELFALLRRHSILSTQLDTVALPGPAFARGVGEGAARDLAASLFGVRAGALLGMRDAADAASYTSGLLIGAEVAARLADTDARCLYVIGEPALASLYVIAIEQLGRRAVPVDGEGAFVAGIAQIGDRLK